ncbi:hypothetical protein [Actinoallomurus sp. CA-142502]|uniref:hypothetical protein n=1 Tax=Actinoallomurus sp. CA-142502 TaxID=3239885 RepID=UPI003D90DCD3
MVWGQAYGDVPSSAAQDPFAVAERDTRAMVSSGWWSGTPPQQRQHLIAGRMLALPDGSWWIFGAWGRWYRLTPADAQWHLCPPPQLAMTRRSARPLQQGMPVPPVPPHVVPTGPDLAYAPPPALAFVDAGIRPEVTSRVRAIVESAAALPTHDYPHWWGLFSSGVPSTVAVTWGVMLWCATAPVFDARIDAQLLSLWSSHRTRPLPDIDGPRWLTPPPLEALVGLYTERLRSGRVDAAVVILRTMWAMAGALREDSRFQARADALIAMLGVTLQNPTVDYGALSYGDQAVVQQWLTRCPPALAPALRVEASTGEHFRNSYYDLALAVTPIAGDPGSRGYVEPRLIAAALLAADLAVVRQDVSGQVIGWLDPQVSDAMRAMLIQRDHPLRPFWPEGDRLPRSLRDGIEAAEPAVRGALLATMYAADLAWCRLGGGIPARPRGFPSSVAILAEIIGPSRATSATASEPVSHTPGIAPLAHQYPSNPGASPQTPGVPLAQQPPTGPPGQAPAWTPPAPGGGAAGAPPATEAWDAAQPWPADPGRETPKSGPPATEAWQGASGLPANTPPRTEAWPGTDPAPASPPGTAGGETPSSPPPTEAWSATEGADPHPAAPERYGPGAQPLPPRTQAWPGTDPAGKPSPPPATQAWPGTDPGSGGASGGAGKAGSPPATQAWPGTDPGSDRRPGGVGEVGSPPATQAWPGADPGSDRRPGGAGEVGSPPATQAWPGTDPGSGQGSGGAGKAGSPPATQAWPGADPGSGAGQGFGGVGSPPTTQADVGTDPGSGVGLGPAGRGETAPAGEVGHGSGSESREAGTVPPATLVEPVSDDSGSGPAAAQGTGADTPAPPPATQAWPGTGDEHAGASGTEARSPDPAASTSSTEPSEEPPPAGGLTPPHAAQAWPSTEDATGGPPPAPQARPGGHTAASTSELNAEGADGGASASSSASEAGTGGAAVGGSGVSSAPAGPGVGADGSGSPRASRAQIEGADGGAPVSPRASEAGTGGAAVGGSGVSSAPAGPGAGVDGSASEAVGAGGPASLSATQADEGSASEPLAGAPNAAGEGSGPQGGATSGGGDANGLTSSAARPDTGEHQAEASGRPATRAWSGGDGDGSGAQAGVAGGDGGVGGGSSSSAVAWSGGDSGGSGSQAGEVGGDEDSGGLTSPSAADVSPGEGGASAGGSDGTSVPAVQSGAGEDGVGGTPPAAQAGTGESATGPGAPIAGRPMAEGVSAESPRDQAGVEDSDAGGGSAVAAEQAGAGGGDEGSPSRVRTSSHAEGIGGGHSPTAAPDSGNRAGQTGSPSSDDSAVAPEEARTESGSPAAGAVGVDRASDDSDPGDDTAEDASDAPSGARIASSASDDASVAQPGVSEAAAAQAGVPAAQAGGDQGAPAASSGPFAGGAFHNQTIADPIAFQYLGDDATVVDAEGEDDTVDDRALGVTMMDSLEEHVNHATSLDALEQAKNATYLDWITGTRADAGSIPIVLPPTPVPPGPPRTRMIEQQDPQPPERPGTRIMSEADLFGSAPMPERPVEQIAPPPPPAPMPKVAERFGIRFLCGADDATELFDGLHRRGQQPGQQPGQRLALLIVGEPHTGQRRLTRLVARSLAGAGVGDGSVRTADGSELRGDHVTAVTAILRGAGPPLLFERLDRAVLDAADPARVVAAVTGARENKAALIATCDPASYARLPAELTRVFQVFRLPDLTNIQARMALLHVLADERRVTITAAGLDVVRGDLTRLTGHGDLVGARLVEAYLDRAVARHIDRAGAPRDRMVLVPVDFVGVAEEIEPALRPPRDVDGYLRGLEEMVGLDEVKRTVGGLVAEARVAAGRGVRGHGGPGRHLVFLGRPGTGKATVAGLIGGIYAALNLLDTGQLVVRGARDLAGGDTAAKVVASVDQATGGVLFIEDAHLLAHLPAAVEHLSRLMAERRDRFMVICASPPGEMEDFLRANPGFRAEFGAIVEFGEPTERQLVQLFSRLAERDLYMLDEELRVELIDRFAGMRRYPEFAFADTVRRLFDQIVARQAARLAGSRVDPAAVARLTVGDLPEAQAGQLLHELHLDRRRPPHPRPPGGV